MDPQISFKNQKLSVSLRLQEKNLQKKVITILSFKSLKGRSNIYNNNYSLNGKRAQQYQKFNWYIKRQGPKPFGSNTILLKSVFFGIELCLIRCPGINTMGRTPDSWLTPSMNRLHPTIFFRHFTHLFCHTWSKEGAINLHKNNQLKSCQPKLSKLLTFFSFASTKF